MDTLPVINRHKLKIFISAGFFSFITVSLSVVFMLMVIQPTWSALNLHVPGEINTKVDFTQPVDAIFYIRNADLGYRDGAETSVSVPFHPLVSLLINAFPLINPINYRFWFISLLTAFLALTAVFFCYRDISQTAQSPKVILLALLLPGGLAMATGNAEYPCLLFTSLIVLSIFKKWPLILTIIISALAILTKPNALYMVPFLAIYFIDGLQTRDMEFAKRNVAGILSILIVWIALMLYVGITLGQIDIYWRSRDLYSPPLSAGILTFFQQFSRIFVHDHSSGERLKYITALAIPTVDMWLLIGIRLKEKHKLSILAGLLSILVITFITNNPNKVIVYAATFPGHFFVGFAFIEQAFQKRNLGEIELGIIKILRYSSGVIYILFCLLMGIFFILGTPLEWYF